MPNILTLPNELQIEVFWHYFLELNQSDGSDVRFILASVCSHWRNLIFSESLLWKSIAINITSVIPRPLFYAPNEISLVDPKDIFLRTMIAFKNACHLPVNLTIVVPDTPLTYFNVRHTDLLAEILCKEASRIASVSISGDSWVLHLSLLRGFLDQPMPLLHTFSHTIWKRFNVSAHYTFDKQLTNLAGRHIPVLQYPHQDNDMAKVNAWGRKMYPKLQNVYISGAPYEWDKLPTQGLKELGMCNQPIMACPSYGLMRQLLSFSAPTLEQLEVHGFLSYIADPDSVEERTFHPVVLPAVKTLSLGYQAPDEVTTFLPSIRTPALQRLNVSDIYSPPFIGDEVFLPTDNMLRSMIQYLPLHNLDVLELDRVVFQDDLPPPEILHWLVEGNVPAEDVPFTMRFLAALTSLKHLDIWAADDSLLYYLNYPAKPNYDKDGQALHDGVRKLRRHTERHLPYLPTLETLYLHGEGEKVFLFLVNRVHYTIREKPLHVTIEETVTDRIDKHKLAILQDMISSLACRSTP